MFIIKTVICLLIKSKTYSSAQRNFNVLRIVLGLLQNVGLIKSNFSLKNWNIY